MPKRVLYLSYTGMTDPLGQSQVLAYLHQLTVSKGYLFTLISFEKEAAYRQHSSRIREFCKKYEIAWHPLRYTKRPPVLSTFIDIWRMRKLAIKLTGTFQFDIVHCRSYIPSLVGLRLKKNERIPFLFDMRGFWADERLDGNIWKKSNPIFNGIYKYFKRKEKQFLKSADHIVSLTQNAKEEILSWKITHDQLPITVIPCCADTDQFNPAIISVLAKESLRHELNISKEAPVISYIGSLGTWYMLEEMLDFFKVWHDKENNAIFLFLTAESEDFIITSAMRKGLAPSSIRVKKVDRHLMPLYISLSDLSLFFIKPAYSKKASSPVKQGELMAIGIPIVCNQGIGDTDSIVRKYNAGIVLENFTEEEYLDAMISFRSKVFKTAEIRKGAIDFFSLSDGVDKYDKIYKSICGEQS